MRATGGPIEAMDAMVESLIDYRGWFVGFADSGLPGAPPEARPSMSEPRLIARGGSPQAVAEAVYRSSVKDRWLYVSHGGHLDDTGLVGAARPAADSSGLPESGRSITASRPDFPRTSTARQDLGDIEFETCQAPGEHHTAREQWIAHRREFGRAR